MTHYGVESQRDKHEQVAGVEAVPDGADQERDKNFVSGHSRVHGKPKPFSRKYVPVIYELLQTSSKLEEEKAWAIYKWMNYYQLVVHKHLVYSVSSEM